LAPSGSAASPASGVCYLSAREIGYSMLMHHDRGGIQIGKD